MRYDCIDTIGAIRLVCANFVIVCLLCITTSSEVAGGVTTMSPDFPLDLPEGCHAQLRVQPHPSIEPTATGQTFSPKLVTLSGSASYAAGPPLRASQTLGQLESFDIVCIAPEITIASPLRSSGGTIVIMTKTLKLNAQIDSRPYFRTSTVDHYISPSEWPRYTESSIGLNARIYNEYDVRVSDILNYDAGIANFYRDYYIRCQDCMVTDQETWMPELPAGLTPPFVNWVIFSGGYGPGDFPRPGLPTSYNDLDNISTRSGDIIIAAEKIEYARPTSGVGTSFDDPPDPLDCNPKPSLAQPLINARGDRGGRGGLGQPSNDLGSPVIRAKKPGFSGGYAGSGMNAPGGPGGDGGNVYLYLFDQPPGSSVDELPGLASVDGGPQGSSIKLKVPSEITKSPLGICAVNPLPQPWPLAERGKSGSIIRRTVSQREAWQKVLGAVSGLDSMFSYNLADLAKRAQVSTGVVSTSFAEHIDARIAVMVSKAQARLARRTIALVTRQVPATDSLVLQDLPIWSIDHPDIPADAPGNINVALSELLTLSGKESGSLVDSYLTANGGVAYVLRTAPQLETDLHGVQEAVRTQQKTLTAINAALGQLSNAVVDIDLQQASQPMLEHANTLKTALKSLTDRYEAEHQAYSNAYQRAFGDYAQGVGGLVLAAAKNDPSSLKDSANKLGRAFVDLFQLHGVSVPTTLETEKQLRDAEEALTRFKIESSALRQQIATQNAIALEQALRARSENAVSLRNRTRLFAELYKHAWLTLAADPSQNIQAFTSNLRALESYANLAVVPLAFDLANGLGPERCNSVAMNPGMKTRFMLAYRSWDNSNDCLIVVPSNSSRLFRAHLQVQEFRPSLPLLWVAPFNNGAKGVDASGFGGITVEIR